MEFDEEDILQLKMLREFDEKNFEGKKLESIEDTLQGQ